jgi:hypothetical protein
MKPFFTLLLACMISLSLAGQQNLKEWNDLKKLHDLKKESLYSKHSTGLSKSENRFSGDPISATKSTLEKLMQLRNLPQKAAPAAMMQMDSLLVEMYDTVNKVWVLIERELHSYDGEGNMTVYIKYEYDSTAMKIMPVDKEIVTYNPQGYPTEIIWQEWDSESGQWVNEGKFELVYDGEGMLVQNLTYFWDEDQWLLIVQIDMTYEDGALVEQLVYNWNEDSAKLILISKYEFIYDNGKLTICNDYLLNEGDWMLYIITTYEYDAGGNMTLELMQTQDWLTEEWIDNSKFIWTYDASNRVISEEYWDSEINMQTLQFEMVRQWLWLFTWDADGNMIEEVDQVWNSDAGEWQNNWKYVWAFNKNYTILDLYVPYWFQGNIFGDDTELMFWHMPVSITESEYINGQWVELYRQTAYYSEFGGGGPSGILDVSEAAVSVFPNPASDFITFSWDEKYNQLDLELYDLTGKQLLFRTIENNTALRVADLSKGVYLYKLSNNKHLVNIGKISLK